jgi:hypothetical protein
MTSYVSAEHLPGGFAHWNHAMKSVRISIEWNYGYTASLFRYLTNTGKLQVLGGETTAKVYTVATIMRNLHVILNGGQSSNYFGLNFDDWIDFLEHYIKGTRLEVA